MKTKGINLMTLSTQQKQDTIKELNENLCLASCSIEELVLALQTTPEKIKNILSLSITSLEEPWILKNYLIKQIIKQKKQPYPFTALAGDYHDYWFLDTKRIEQGTIG